MWARKHDGGGRRPKHRTIVTALASVFLAIVLPLVLKSVFADVESLKIIKCTTRLSRQIDLQTDVGWIWKLFVLYISSNHSFFLMSSLVEDKSAAMGQFLNRKVATNSNSRGWTILFGVHRASDLVLHMILCVHYFGLTLLSSVMFSAFEESSVSFELHTQFFMFFMGSVHGTCAVLHSAKYFRPERFSFLLSPTVVKHGDLCLDGPVHTMSGVLQAGGGNFILAVTMLHLARLTMMEGNLFSWTARHHKLGPKKIHVF